jgi:hypothetical protein
MKATDLLGAQVYDSAGRHLGAVRDLHIRRGGRQVTDSGQPAYRLTGLECGPAGIAHRLGYGHRDLAGPRPLAGLLARFVRRAKLVAWDQIADLDGARITLTVTADELSPVGREQSDD